MRKNHGSGLKKDNGNISARRPMSGAGKARAVEHMDGKQRPRLNDLTLVDTNTFVQNYKDIYDPPQFSLKQIREAIPAILFRRSLFKSSFYTIANIIYVSLLVCIIRFLDTNLPDFLRSIAWLFYWWFQGIGFVGIWVLAHECGHQAFSDFKSINNIIGFTLHTFVLVPYFSWQISHARHHSSTSNMKGDTAYVPRTKEEYRSWGDPPPPWVEAIETTPIFTFLKIVSLLIFGWPAYLLVNISGQSYPGITTHFSPSSPIFSARHRIIASNIGLLIWISALCFLGYHTSFRTIFYYYLIPYLGVNAWVIVITLLQHTDIYIPHYSEGTWNFVRGAVSTVDRDYGWFLNHAFHHVTESHVVHHLFSTMPFYNAIKATPYVQQVLGEHYLNDTTPIAKALWRAVTRCHYVEDHGGGILFYHE